MEKTELGITGKIESIPVAKRIVRIAAAAMLLLSFVGFLHENYIYGVTVLIALFMALRNARGAALMLFLWMFLDTLLTIAITTPMLAEGRFLRAYLPLFCLIVLWLQYRAVLATFMMKRVTPDLGIDSIQDIFE